MRGCSLWVVDLKPLVAPVFHSARRALEFKLSAEVAFASGNAGGGEVAAKGPTEGPVAKSVYRL